jgi:RNA polymerase sigma-70 factor (ECF subfamily)
MKPARPTLASGPGADVPAGDRVDPSLEAAVREHTPVLTAIANRLCRDRTEARDLVQDTFERAVGAWDRLPPDANVQAWLVTILNRLFIDRCRRAARTEAANVVAFAPVTGEPPVAAAAGPSWAAITAEELAAAVAELDDEFRAAYRMHAIEGRPYREVATALGISENTLGTRLLRARRKLREMLLRRLGEEGGS